MSMKVYNAFRIKNPDDMWPLLWKIRDTAEVNIRQALRDHYWHLVRTMDPDSDEYLKKREKDPDRNEVSFRLGLARDKVRDAYKENTVRSERDTYTLDVPVAVYPHNGQVYLRTFVESISVVGSALDFVRTMPELEDYHYQNQTDKPDEVPTKEWKIRRRVWDEISKSQQGVGNHITLDILSWASFWRFDPWLDLAKEWRDNPPELPIREEIWAEKLRKLESLKGVDIFARKGIIQGFDHFLILHEKDRWTSLVKNNERQHATLNRAADYVWFEYLPELTKNMARRLSDDARERRQRGQR